MPSSCCCCEPPDINPTSGQLALLLSSTKRIAVVGMSDNPSRDSHRIARYLIAQGYEVVPVNPNVSEVMGLTAYPSLSDVPGSIDMADVFRRGDAVPQIVDEALKLGVKSIWLQLGVTNNAAAAKARQAGMTVVQNKCIKVEHARLIGGQVR